MAADPIVIQAVSEQEATCLATALREYAAHVARNDGVWEISIGSDGDPDGVLGHVIEAAMECYADRRVSGFALIADGRRYPLGME
jgi:hypothetical protein